MEYVSSLQLYNLWTSSKLISLIKDENPVMIQQPIKLDQSIDTLLTPFSKKIYDSVTTTEKKRLLEDFKYDNEIIDIINQKQEKEDAEYIYADDTPGTIGFYIEGWLTINYQCPICHEFSLKKFLLPNMPVIDLICTNPLHKINNGVKFFQVKSGITDSIFFKDRQYFSKKESIINDNKYNGYIYVGSKKYGYNAHNINSSADNKDILIGYICINYSFIDDNNIKINIQNSFILLPDKSKNIGDVSYYHYIDDSFGKPIISWNANLVKMDVFMPSTFNIVINLSIIYKELISDNIQKSTVKRKLFGGNLYYYKYLKYKNKYLKLKKN